MIAIDASALVAVILDEPDAPLLASVLSSEASRVPMSAVLEAHIALTRRSGAPAAARLDRLLEAFAIEVGIMTSNHLAAARLAFDRYGKGRHPAALNFGDCLVYGFAKGENLPLLYKGNDFAQTDIAAALVR